MTKLRAGMVALCDAVYKDEASNKIVIAGMYSGNILTDGTPEDLRFALYCEFGLPDALPHSLDIQFWVGGKQIGGARSTVAQPEKTRQVAIILAQFGLLGAADKLPSTLRIKAVLDGGKPITILEKDLILRASMSGSNASPQPS